ncbi:MAG TPA: hypothetical protein VKQ07_08595, partial [Jatrophihabitantaceae bacterium]|nr:hypothetical protein [Jatrophihabitantaceae bacterium]
TPPPGRGGHGDGGDGCCCLGCLLSKGVLTERGVKRLRELGIDVEELRKCIAEHDQPAREKTPVKVRQRPTRGNRTIATEPKAKRAPKQPRVARVKAPNQMPSMPRMVRMHTPPDELEAEPPPDPAHIFPRVIKMFDPPTT